MYNATIAELFQQPYHMTACPEATVIGQDGMPGEGPYMTLYLCLRDNTIQQAYFETYGCPTAIACGSWLVRWVEGKPIQAASIIEPEDLAAGLGGLPLGKEHCASLAVKSLRSAFRQLETST